MWNKHVWYLRIPFFPAGDSREASQTRPNIIAGIGERTTPQCARVFGDVIVVSGHAQSTCVRRAPPAAAGTKPFTLLRHAASAHPIIFMPCIVG